MFPTFHTRRSRKNEKKISTTKNTVTQGKVKSNILTYELPVIQLYNNRLSNGAKAVIIGGTCTITRALLRNADTEVSASFKRFACPTNLSLFISVGCFFFSCFRCFEQKQLRGRRTKLCGWDREREREGQMETEPPPLIYVLCPVRVFRFWGCVCTESRN